MNRNKIRALKIFGIATCAIVFISLAIIIYFYRIKPLAIDTVIRDFAYRIRGNKFGFMYWFFRIITEFGNVLVILLLLVYIGFRTKLDFRFFLITFGVMLSLIINVGMKDMYSRERPYVELRWVNEDSSSFPSGHSTAAGFIYSFLIYLTFHNDMKRWQKNTIYVSCSLLIPLIMFSRIILGVHYFTDVISGCAIGIMVSCLCMILYRYCCNNNILTTGLLKSKKNK